MQNTACLIQPFLFFGGSLASLWNFIVEKNELHKLYGHVCVLNERLPELMVYRCVCSVPVLLKHSLGRAS